MLKGLKGDCQEKEGKRVDQVEGSTCEKPQRCETDGTSESMAGSSFRPRKGSEGPWRVFWEIMPDYEWLDSLA